MESEAGLSLCPDPPRGRRSFLCAEAPWSIGVAVVGCALGLFAAAMVVLLEGKFLPVAPFLCCLYALCGAWGIAAAFDWRFPSGAERWVALSPLTFTVFWLWVSWETLVWRDGGLTPLGPAVLDGIAASLLFTGATIACATVAIVVAGVVRRRRVAG